MDKSPPGCVYSFFRILLQLGRFNGLPLIVIRLICLKINLDIHTKKWLFVWWQFQQPRVYIQDYFYNLFQIKMMMLCTQYLMHQTYFMFYTTYFFPHSLLSLYLNCCVFRNTVSFDFCNQEPHYCCLNPFLQGTAATLKKNSENNLLPNVI